MHGRHALVSCERLCYQFASVAIGTLAERARRKSLCETQETHMDPGTSQPARPSYEPSARDQEAIRKYLARKTSPRVTVSKDEKAVRISLDHPDEVIGQVLLMGASLIDRFSTTRRT
jgi:hypothetical protein